MIRTELFHAMLVHFPIALLLFSFAFFIASRIFQNEILLKVSMWGLVMGTAGAVVAVITGLIAEDIAPHTEQAHIILTTYHEPLGLTVMSWALLLTILSLIVRWKFTKGMSAIFILLFSALIALIAMTGYYGHQMVYEHGMAVSPKIICSKDSHHDHDEEHEKMMKEKSREVEQETESSHEHQHDEGVPTDSH